MKTGDTTGTISHFKNSKLHRDDGPALIFPIGHHQYTHGKYVWAANGNIYAFEKWAEVLGKTHDEIADFWFEWILCK